MSETAENTTNQLNLQKDADYENIVTPFGDDLLGRETLAKHLTGYIDRLKIGAVLAIDAPWGEGKTYFVRHWKKYLEKEDNQHNVIYLNAFAQDYLDDPFMVLAAEISHAFEQVDSSNELVKTFKKQTIDAAKALLPEMPKLLFSLGMFLTGAGYLGKTVQDALAAAQDAIHDDAKEAIEGMGETLQEKLQDAIKERLENHETEKQTLVSFKQSLQKLAADNDLNPKPLVFIIDELDRCNPLFSVRLIERIKHFFDIPNIVFVLVTDKTQLQATICHQFGYNEAAGEAYLDKFIDFSIHLKKPKNQNIELNMASVDLLQKFKFDEYEKKLLIYDLRIYAVTFNLSIRQIIKILNQLVLMAFDTVSHNRILLYCLCNPNFLKDISLCDQILYCCMVYPKSISSPTIENIREEINTLLSYYPEQKSYTFSNILNEKIKQFEQDKNIAFQLGDFNKEDLIIYQMASLKWLTVFSNSDGLKYYDEQKIKQEKSQISSKYNLSNTYSKNAINNQLWIQYLATGLIE